MSYTANIFEFLGDDEDGSRPRKNPTQVSKPSAGPKPAAAKPAATTATPKAPAQQPAAPQQKAAAPAKPAAPAKKEGGVVQPKANGDPHNKGPKTDFVKKPSAQPRQPQQGGAGGNNAAAGAFASEKQPRAPRKDTRDRPPQRGRQFDRRSGTGRPANENKKAGAGKANWGKEDEVPQNVEGATAAEAVEGEKEPTAPNEETVQEGEAAPAKEEEKETLGYAEYLESIKNKTIKGVEAPKIRMAGEGVDQSAWADYAPLAKDDDDEPLKKNKKAGEKKEAAPAKGGEQKVALDKVLKVHMSRPDGDRRDRGDRGDRRDRGDRGDRGDRRDRGDRSDRPPRGGPKGSPKAAPRANQNAPAAQGGLTEADFPSLGGSGGVAPPAKSSPAPAPAPASAPATPAAAPAPAAQAPVKV